MYNKTNDERHLALGSATFVATFSNQNSFEPLKVAVIHHDSGLSDLFSKTKIFT